MTFTGALFSTNSNEWETPQDLFVHYNKLFKFNLDVCASSANNKCIRYFSKSDNGLGRTWSRCNWMNPPYGRQIILWVKKAYEESLSGNTTVCLLPARTDTRWWHDYVLKADSIYFIKGRLKFKQNKKEPRCTAPFPSCIVIFGLSYRK